MIHRALSIARHGASGDPAPGVYVLPLETPGGGQSITKENWTQEMRHEVIWA